MIGQLLNAESSISIILSGSVTEIRFVHPSNKDLEILLMPSGIVTFVRLVQSENALLKILHRVCSTNQKHNKFNV